MTSAYSKTLKVSDYDSFRDELASSGVFDMTDCEVQIWCPLESDVKEVQKMVTLLESMVHVTDVAITSEVEEMTSMDHYRIVITEVTNRIPKNRFSRER